MIRGSLPAGADHRATTLYSVGAKRPDHDAVMRIGGEAPRRRTHSRNRCQHQGLLRVTATSDHHRKPTMLSSVSKSPLLPIPAHAARNTTPAGTSPVVTSRHRAISNLRARATIIVLRFFRRSLFVSDTTGSMRCPSGKAKSAKPVGSSRGVRVRYPPWRAPSFAACCRSHLGRQ